MSEFWSVSLPTWLSSIGTIGAFTTGGVLLIRELRRDREREFAALREKASLISAWPQRYDQPSSDLATKEARLNLSNHSTEPVYSVSVEYLGAAPEVRDVVGMLPPGQHPRDLPEFLRETWVRSGDGWVIRGRHGQTVAENPDASPWPFEVVLRFTDAAGRRWRRDQHGVLTHEGV